MRELSKLPFACEERFLNVPVPVALPIHPKRLNWKVWFIQLVPRSHYGRLYLKQGFKPQSSLIRKSERNRGIAITDPELVLLNAEAAI